MSLNPTEQANTKRELRENFDLAKVTAEQAARDLDTTVTHFEDVLQLDSTRIEEPWIIKQYLNDKIVEQGKEPVPYSKLVGDPANYWFLDDGFIKQGKLIK
ncbi:DUF2316 family protein [Fructilactobacillus sp. Tb1]|uniref:DUF2316 family protein n=1 Tax=Fructilactobacillus sp. Tb1 TaxID=3422304 RepID=UPI003D27FC09